MDLYSRVYKSLLSWQVKCDIKMHSNHTKDPPCLALLPFFVSALEKQLRIWGHVRDNLSSVHPGTELCSLWSSTGLLFVYLRTCIRWLRVIKAGKPCPHFDGMWTRLFSSVLSYSAQVDLALGHCVKERLKSELRLYGTCKPTSEQYEYISQLCYIYVECKIVEVVQYYSRDYSR